MLTWWRRLKRATTAWRMELQTTALKMTARKRQFSGDED
jgi:hypothetical protein